MLFLCMCVQPVPLLVLLLGLLQHQLALSQHAAQALQVVSPSLLLQLLQLSSQSPPAARPEAVLAVLPLLNQPSSDAGSQ